MKLRIIFNDEFCHARNSRGMLESRGVPGQDAGSHAVRLVSTAYRG